MLLRDEESVEIPEACLDEARRFRFPTLLEEKNDVLPVCGHLLKPHIKKDLPKFMPHFVYCV